MKTQLFNKAGSDIVIFFEGYGQDPNPFSELVPLMSENTSLLCCYDYAVDEALPDLSSFENARVIAWSMGVALAPFYIKKLRLRVTKSIAVNGTLEGIDENLGVDPVLWDETLAKLDAHSAMGFYLAMCGSSFKKYIEKRPNRSIESLKAELAWIRDYLKSVTVTDYSFDEAFVSKRDLIFNPCRQKLSWEKHGVKLFEIDEAHYCPELFERLLREPFDGS